MSEASADPQGILLVDKPAGITSHDVVDQVRRLYQTRRVGHAGTLDPMATGLLIILVGKATKASQYLMSQEKEYLGEVTLMLGDQYQTPPMHSAKKIGGKKLYELARKGLEVEREPRFIRINLFQLNTWQSPRFTFRVQCTKGTYVRTLAYDLGQKFGCGAHLSMLRRTASGELSIEKAHTLDALEKMSREQKQACLIPVQHIVPIIALG
ncbi:MAG: tRNA pseudouridine(55) synthase TruB [Verrucomicrobia bacterium]|nr:tRNA pseudouridine(55) synthase TruB [Verrucomicrobiota bacterium]